MITIETPVKEKGTAKVNVVFTDENGVVPDDNAIKSIKWSLIDLNGLPINGREDIEVTSLASSFSVLLYGDDLAVQPYEATAIKILRRFVVEITYQSTLGNNLPANEFAQFEIENLPKIGED